MSVRAGKADRVTPFNPRGSRVQPLSADGGDLQSTLGGLVGSVHE